MTKLYLAYGSNLNLEQMKFRCPEATLVGTTKLKDYKLTYMDNGSGCGVMNIESCNKNEIPVAIFSISESDEKELDYYEGFPFLYYKELLQVELNGKNVEVMAYIMHKDGHEYANPIDRYYKIIYQGYKDCGFDTKYLEQITKENRENVKKNNEFRKFKML